LPKWRSVFELAVAVAWGGDMPHFVISDFHFQKMRFNEQDIG
jgi:hypothetical protein